MKLIMENWKKFIKEGDFTDRTIPLPPNTNWRGLNYKKILDSLKSIKSNELWWAWVKFLHKSYCSTQDDPDSCMMSAESYTSRKEFEEYFEKHFKKDEKE